MKKLKLRKWVKVVIITLILLGVAILGNNLEKKAIDECVSAGNSYQHCVEGLK